MIDWLRAHEGLLGWLFALSVVSLLMTAVLLPIVVVRLPADYFDPRRERHVPRGALALLERVVRNAAGGVFVLAGLAMLVLPGQGVLTILIGLLLIDFPGKIGVERWLVQRRGVLKTMNRLRERFGHEPLRL